MLQTKYITVDEFNEYFGDVDLRALLKVESNAVAFLKRIEDRMQVYINSNFNKNIDEQFPVFTENQKEHYKLALLEQAIYIIRNGDISVDSGYDFESGVKADSSTIKSIAISQNAIDHLIMCGLWSRNLKGSRRGWWFNW